MFHCVLITCSITIQWTKQWISQLMAVEEAERQAKAKQVPLSSTEEDTDDSVDTTQGNYTMIISLQYTVEPVNQDT